MSFAEVALFATPLLLGIALLLASWWARRRAARLLQQQPEAQAKDFARALIRGELNAAGKLYLFGPLSPGWQRLASGLALGITVIVGTGLVALLALLAGLP